MKQFVVDCRPLGLMFSHHMAEKHAAVASGMQEILTLPLKNNMLLAQARALFCTLPFIHATFQEQEIL